MTFALFFFFNMSNFIPHVLKSINPRNKTFNYGIAHHQRVSCVAEDLSENMRMRPSGNCKYVAKSDCLTQVPIGEGKTGVIYSLARCEIFWATMKLEARRGALCE